MTVVGLHDTGPGSFLWPGLTFCVPPGPSVVFRSLFSISRACLAAQQHASVSKGRIFSDNCMSDTLRWKLQIKLAISPSHRILKPGQPVPALTLQRQAPGRIAFRVPIIPSLARLDAEKSLRRKRESNPVCRYRCGRLIHY